MTESDFWPALEYRVCRELEGMDDERRSLWCDGFIPDEYHLEDTEPRITGRAWIGRGPDRQEAWPFRLDLDAPAHGKDSIHWEELLPAEEQTAWLAVDVERRTVRISPHLAE